MIQNSDFEKFYQFINEGFWIDHYRDEGNGMSVHSITAKDFISRFTKKVARLDDLHSPEFAAELKDYSFGISEIDSDGYAYLYRDISPKLMIKFLGNKKALFAYLQSMGQFAVELFDISESES